jgi:hypothetical protein
MRNTNKIEKTVDKNFEPTHCCQLIYGTKCPSQILSKLSTPLEMSYPKIFGKLDKDQEELIKYNSTPLILIENASEFVNKMKNINGFIEQIMGFVIKDNKSKFTYLGTFTFHYFLRSEMVDMIEEKKMLYDPPGKDEQNFERYQDELNLVLTEMKRKIKKDKNKDKIILQVGIDLGFGGHYGIIIKDKDECYIFDSMQVKGWSHYSGFFYQLAVDVFNTVDVKTTVFGVDECLQITGGFTNKNDSFSKKQNMDSQNHFCYIWSILYFHVYIAKPYNLTLNALFPYIKKNFNHPLIVVKKYIWAILHSFYPTNEKLKDLFREVIKEDDVEEINNDDLDFLTKFFIINFRFVWDEFFGSFTKYQIIDCDVSRFRKMTNINECLLYALEPSPYYIF